MKLFGTDGIRGRVNRPPMTVETALAVGRAAVAVLRNEAGDSPPVVIIGQDTRQSSGMLACALAAGVSAMGAEARLAGVLPTPGVALLARLSGALAGIVVSASHNPWDDNGIKIFNGRGFKLSDEQQAAVEAWIAGPGGTREGCAGPEVGRVASTGEFSDIYITYIKRYINSKTINKDYKILMDCANGATHHVAPRIFEGVGARVEALFVAPDGRNINAGCGSEHLGALRRKVLETGADVGLAFDGDGDRLLAVDEAGAVLSGDRVLAICARHLLRSGRLKDKVVVSTVMSNIGLRLALERMGIRWAASDVGDRRVVELMHKEGAVLGGEDSGHTIFLDRHTTGDGILSAVELLDAMAVSGEPLSRLARVMEAFPQELINVNVRRKPPMETLPEVESAIRAAEKRLGRKGRVLVRYSGTENKCRVMVEGPDPEETRRLCEEIAGVVEAVLG